MVWVTHAHDVLVLVSLSFLDGTWTVALGCGALIASVLEVRVDTVKNLFKAGTPKSEWDSEASFPPSVNLHTLPGWLDLDHTAGEESFCIVNLYAYPLQRP